MKNFIYYKLVSYENANIHYVNKYIKFIYSRKNIKTKYTQKHHVLPKGLYSNFSKLHLHDWNGVYLTYREHFIAHWMLAKALGGTMWIALNLMRKHNKSSKLYEVAFKNMQKANSDIAKKRVISEETKKKISKSLKGRKLNKETIVKIKETKKLNNTPRKPLSEETKKRISEAKKGVPSKRTSRDFTKEWKENISKGQIGRTHSNETKLKMSLTKKGKKQEIVTCPYCNKCGGINNMKRYHFDNCKSKHN